MRKLVFTILIASALWLCTAFIPRRSFMTMHNQYWTLGFPCTVFEVQQPWGESLFTSNWDFSPRDAGANFMLWLVPAAVISLYIGGRTGSD